MRWALVAIALLALLTSGCQRRTTGATVSDYQQKRAALLKKRARQQPVKHTTGATRIADANSEGPVYGATAQGYHYDPTGKRDPFRSFVLARLDQFDETAKGPLEQFDLNQLSVVGIVWDAQRRRALIQDPSGRDYVVQEGTAIGKNEGRVVRIGDNIVLVQETYVDYVGDKTMKDIPMTVRPPQGG